MVCGESPVCGYAGIAITVIAGHIKVHIKIKYENVVIFKLYVIF
jgi:hypothetical protein